MGENEYGESGHLSIFTLLKHLMMRLKYTFFQGFIFTTLPKTLIACREMQLRFFQSENIVKQCLLEQRKEIFVSWSGTGFLMAVTGSTRQLFNKCQLDPWTATQTP